MKTDQETPTPPAAIEPIGKDRLLALLQELGIAADTIDHPALHAVDDAQAWRAANLTDQKGGHCKKPVPQRQKGRALASCYA